MRPARVVHADEQDLGYVGRRLLRRMTVVVGRQVRSSWAMSGLHQPDCDRRADGWHVNRNVCGSMPANVLESGRW
jgi:hypothetical protein